MQVLPPGKEQLSRTEPCRMGKLINQRMGESVPHRGTKGGKSGGCLSNGSLENCERLEGHRGFVKN